VNQSAATGLLRDQPLPLPPENLDLSGFPARTIRAGRRLFRAHAEIHGTNCWYFANLQTNKDPGRFDGPSPGFGTCYMATDPLTALAERAGFKVLVGPGISFTALDGALLSEVITTRPYRVADLTHRTSLKYWACGRELSAMTPYALSHAWASLWQHANFEGILYFPRHDSRAHVRSLALFDSSLPDSNPGLSDPIPDPNPEPAKQYLNKLAHAYGLSIKGHLSEFEVLPPEPDLV